MTEWANEVKVNSNLPQQYENGITWTDIYRMEGIDALVYKYIGIPDRNSTKEWADQLWLNTNGELIKSVGFTDILFLFTNDYSRQESGVYSSKYTRWFSSMEGYATFAN
jgi:hypothetical protein